MENSITIRPIHNEYCNQIIDIILTIQRVEFSLPITINHQPDLMDIETNYHKDGGCFWGAFLDNELIGTIALIYCGHETGCIRKMFVKKEFRGRGFGTAQLLLNTLLQYCRDQQLKHIYLGTVHQLKAAHRFYERNGFFAINVIDLPAYFPLMKTDNMFYQLHLTN
jgi:GNAT superfamily N-acetyltransferase